MTTDNSRRSHLMRGLRDAVVAGLIHNYHVRDLAYAHAYEAKVEAPRSFFGDWNVAALCATLAGVFGGRCADPDGNAAVNLNRALKHPMSQSAFNSQMLMQATERGLVTKKMHLGGRRTDEIRITTKGMKLIGPPPYDAVDFWLPGYEAGGKWNRRRAARPLHVVAAHVPEDTTPELTFAEVAAPVEPAVLSDNSDVIALQRLVLRLAEQRDRAEANVDDMIGRLSHADEEIQRLKALIPESEIVYTNGRDLRSRLSDAEAASLERLMREVPSG